MIEDDLTVTSKGTVTLPVKMRRLLGLGAKGAKLRIRFYVDTSQAIISKPVDFESVQQLSQKHIRKRRPPLTDVSGFYAKRRGRR